MQKKYIYPLPFVLACFSMMLIGFKQAPKPAEPVQNQRPNVLFIVVDDMNLWGVLNNYPALKVPNINKLVSQSYYFKNAACAAPVCIPSRASFWSGKYPHNSGVYRNGPDVWNTSKLLTEVEAMPELFKRNGYTTWGGGKTFHVKLPGNREQRMFDNKVINGNYGPFATGRGQWFNIKPWEGPDTDFTDVVTANGIIDFLGQSHDKPFFMYYGLYRPHAPYTVPKRFFDMYDGVKFTLPPGFQENDLNDVPAMGKELADNMKQLMNKGMPKEEAWLTYMKAYCANTSFADWSLGRVLDALDKSAYGKNTIVIFCSDNGFHNGAKNHWTKQTLWEQADAVPFLVRLPDGKAYTCPQTVSLVDIYPTLVEYCNLAAPKQKLDGQSLVPVFKDPKFKWSRPALTTFGENYSSVRSEQYRYIKYPDGTEELYDHYKDPYEHANVASKPEMKAVKAVLAKAIPAQFQKSVPVKNEEGEKTEAAAKGTPGEKKGNQKPGGKKKKAANK